MASIAGLPQAPSRDKPVANPASFRKAQSRARAHATKRQITKAEYDEAIATPLNLTTTLR